METQAGVYQLRWHDEGIVIRVDCWAKRFYEYLTENARLLRMQPVYPDDDALVQPSQLIDPRLALHRWY